MKLSNKKLKNGTVSNGVKKILIFLFVILLIVLGLVIYPNLVFSPIDTSLPETSEDTKTSDEIDLIFVGDIMLDRNVKNKINSVGNGDYKFPFLLLANELNSADITIGNLETTISERGYPTRELYLFRSSPDSVKGLTYAGFDVLSVANNHSNDYGRIAFEDTINFLEKANITSIGGGMNISEAYKAKFIEIENTTIAFLAFSDFAMLIPTKTDSGMATTLDENLMWSSINEAKEEADIVIVLFHYGDEYELKPNERQVIFSRKAIDYGADLIIGSHPHVIQTTEKYKNGFIAYSLGNFIFDQDFSEQTMTAGILKVKIKDQKIKSFDLQKAILNDNYQPYLSNS
ncbi:MAG: CapA family protein [Candidatus Paceibacterota bacterium]